MDSRDETAGVVDEQNPGSAESESESESSAETVDDPRFAAVARQTSDIVWAFMNEYNQVQDRRKNESTTAPSSSPKNCAADQQQQQRSSSAAAAAVSTISRRRQDAGTQTTTIGNDDELLEQMENVLQPSTRKITVDEFAMVDQQLNPEARRVAHSLIGIAEEMDRTYRPTVVVLVSRWLMSLHRDNGGRLTFNSVWTAFRRVVDAVLSTGVTWGKMLLLLLFAYEIAVALYVEGVPQFVRDIISAFVKLLIESQVIRWIVEHGGWAAAVTALWMECMKAHIRAVAPYVAWVIGLGAMALGAVLFAKRK